MRLHTCHHLKDGAVVYTRLLLSVCKHTLQATGILRAKSTPSPAHTGRRKSRRHGGDAEG